MTESKAASVALQVPAGQRWFDISVARKAAPDHGSPTFLLISRDITERKETTASLQQLNEALEQRVQSRTSELLGAKNEAERANDSKSEFLSRMSHELRTPLNAILGFAQLLKMSTAEPLGAEQWERVDVLERAGRHLLALVNDVLDLSRIEAGHMALHIGAMGVRGVFDEVHSLVVSTAHAHRVTLHRPIWPDLPEGPLTVRADMLRLQQVLVNLMTNAIKYNRPGGDVWLAASLVGNEVCLSVRDNGHGMTTEQQAHLFEPFNRLGAETSDIDGSGIGMVIVQRLVQLMGGRLSLRSAPLHNSTICLLMRSVMRPMMKTVMRLLIRLLMRLLMRLLEYLE